MTNNIKRGRKKVGMNLPQFEQYISGLYSHILEPGDIWLHTVDVENGRDLNILVLMLHDRSIRLYNPSQTEELLNWHVLRGLPKTITYGHIKRIYEAEKQQLKEYRAIMAYEEKYPNAHIRKYQIM